MSVIKKRQILINIVLMLGTTLMLLLVMELCCRFVLYRQTPADLVFDDSIIYSGKPHGNLFKRDLNDIGCIGDDILMPKAKNEKRIFLLGGSTSFSTEYVDALRDEVASLNPKYTVKVVSCGKPRYTSYNNLVNLKNNLLQLSPDAIVVYLGINDSIYNSFPWVEDIPDVGFFDYGNMGTSLLIKFFKYYVYDKRIRSISEFSTGHLRSSDILERNVTEIIDVAQKNGIKVVLATFGLSYPTKDQVLEKSILGKEQEMLHFWGNVKSTVHSVDEHNKVIKKIAEMRNIPLAETVRAIPADTQHFKDICHKTSMGNQILGKIIGRTIGDLDTL